MKITWKELSDYITNMPVHMASQTALIGTEQGFVAARSIGPITDAVCVEDLGEGTICIDIVSC